MGKGGNTPVLRSRRPALRSRRLSNDGVAGLSNHGEAEKGGTNLSLMVPGFQNFPPLKGGNTKGGTNLSLDDKCLVIEPFVTLKAKGKT